MQKLYSKLSWRKRNLGVAFLGLALTAGLSLTALSALGAFNATIVNPGATNGAGSGSLVLAEGTPTLDCWSTGTAGGAVTTANSDANCTNNAFGSYTEEPAGAATTTTLTLENLGSLSASELSLTPALCAQGDNTFNGNTYFGAAGFFTLSAALNTGSPITSLPVTALAFGVSSGDALVLTSGANTQTFTTTAAAGLGATSISVTSQTPNFAYPTSTSYYDLQQSICGKEDVTIGDSAKCFFPSSASPCGAPTNSNTLATLGTSTLNLGALASNSSLAVTFTSQLDTSANNSYQGLLAGTPMTWELVQ